MRFRWFPTLLCAALPACQSPAYTALRQSQAPTAETGPVSPMTTQALVPVAAPVAVPILREAGTASRQAAIFPGGSAIKGSEPTVRIAQGGRVDLDLVDVDVATAARAILGDLLKVNYAIDPRVQGRVTVKTPNPISTRESIALFEDALSQIDVGLSERNGAYVIAPITPGRTPTAALAIRNEGDGAAALGYGTRAVSLKYVPAKEMAEIIQQLSPDAVVRIDAERNLLVLKGSGAQFGALLETIRTFDVDWLANKAVGLFPIETMPADAMAKSLGEVMANENINATMARITTLDANNSVMIVAKTPQVLATMRRWVSRLDRRVPSALRLYSHQMRFARATQVAPLIAGALGLPIVASGREAGGQRRTGQGQAAGGFNNRGFGGGSLGGGGLGGGGSGAGSFGPGGLGGGSDTGAFGAPGGSGPGPSGPRAAGVPEIDPARALLGSAGAASRQGGDSGPRLVVDEATNKILVYATEDINGRVLQFLRTLDVSEKQVLVEATIIEVTLSDQLRFGTQYVLNKLLNGTKIRANLTPNASGVVGPQSPGGVLTVGVSTQALIDTLSQLTKVQVVSSPNLMVLNNQSARLVVGDQVPVTSQTRNDPTTANNVTVSAVDFRDTGIIFDVTPRVNAGGTVTLDILQEVSSVKDGSTALIPTIAQRRLNTVVTANNGETIVLGGLFSTERQSNSGGIPGLNTIPILGAVLGTQTSGFARTELLVMINARVITGQDDARAVTNEMRERIDGLRLIETGPCRRDRGCVTTRG